MLCGRQGNRASEQESSLPGDPKLQVVGAAWPFITTGRLMEAGVLQQVDQLVVWPGHGRAAMDPHLPICGFGDRKRLDGYLPLG